MELRYYWCRFDLNKILFVADFIELRYYWMEISIICGRFHGLFQISQCIKNKLFFFKCKQLVIELFTSQRWDFYGQKKILRIRDVEYPRGRWRHIYHGVQVYIPLRDKETRMVQIVLIIVLVRFGSFFHIFSLKVKIRLGAR